MADNMIRSALNFIGELFGREEHFLDKTVQVTLILSSQQRVDLLEI